MIIRIMGGCGENDGFVSVNSNYTIVKKKPTKISKTKYNLTRVDGQEWNTLLRLIPKHVTVSFGELWCFHS